ncbi:hypothetical protein G6F31_016673 [Rhizopus arrhizus]|nr:hypothetical protein G6F31_016673 [Rhizopus arrhizus]
MGLVARALAHHVDRPAGVGRAEHHAAGTAQHFNPLQHGGVDRQPAHRGIDDAGHAIDQIVAVVHGEAADRELVVAEVARGLGHARGLCQCLVQRGEVAVIQLLAGDHADRLRGLADALPQLAQAQLTCRVGAIALAIGGHIHRLQGGLGILAARR